MHLGFFTVVLFFLQLHHHATTAPSVIPGYLDFDNLPETNFSCLDKVIGGYYADIETGCQMFHVCTIGQKGEVTDIKFLCLNGTVFDQETRVCERVDEVDCSKAEEYFDLNLELYGNNAFNFQNDDEETEISSHGDHDSQKQSTTQQPPTTTTPRPTEPPTTTPKPTTPPPSLQYLSVTTHRPYYNTHFKHNTRLTPQNHQNRHQQNPVNDYQTISSTLQPYNPTSYVSKTTTTQPKTNPHRYSSTQSPGITPLQPVHHSYDDNRHDDHTLDNNSQFDDVDEYTSSGDGEYEEEDEEEVPIVIHKPISVANRFPVTSIGNENIKVENNGDVNNNRPLNGHSSFTESLSLPHGNTNIRYNVNRGNLHPNHNNQNQYAGGYDSVQETTNIHAQHKINTDFILNRQLESERHKYHGGYNNNHPQSLLNQFTFTTTTPVPQFFNRPVQYSSTIQPYLLPPVIQSSTQPPQNTGRQVGNLKRKLEEEIVASQQLNHAFDRTVNPLFTTPSIAIVSQTSSTSFVSSVSKAQNPSVPSNGTILGISTLASVDGYPTQIVQHNPYNLTLDLTQYVKQVSETTPPSSYDEYSESDVRKDPFFKDVPRISLKKIQLGLRAKRGAIVLSDVLGREQLTKENLKIDDVRPRRQLASVEQPGVISHRRGRLRMMKLTADEISTMTHSIPVSETIITLVNPDILGHSVDKSEETEIQNVQNWRMQAAKGTVRNGGETFRNIKPELRFSQREPSSPRPQLHSGRSRTTNSRNNNQQRQYSTSPTTQRSDVVDYPVARPRTHQRVQQRSRVQTGAPHLLQPVAETLAQPAVQTVAQPVAQPQTQRTVEDMTQQPTPQPTELTLDSPRGPLGRLGISSEAFGPMEVRNRPRLTQPRENRQRALPRPLISRDPIVIIGSEEKPKPLSSREENTEDVVKSQTNTQATLSGSVPVIYPRRNLVSDTRKRLLESLPVTESGAQAIFEPDSGHATKQPLPRRAKSRRVESNVTEGPLIRSTSAESQQENIQEALQNVEKLPNRMRNLGRQEDDTLLRKTAVVTEGTTSRRRNGPRRIDTNRSANSNANRERLSSIEQEIKNRAVETNIEIPRNTLRNVQRQSNGENVRNEHPRSRTPSREVIREEMMRSELAIKRLTADLRHPHRPHKSRYGGVTADQSTAAQMTEEQQVDPEEGTTRLPLPETSFSCADKVPGGYYADLEADCQLFHICSQGRHGRIKDNKFLCGPGTRFNQQSRTCQTRELVDCQLSASLYHLNNHFSPPLQGAVVAPEVSFDPHHIRRGRRSTIEANDAAGDLAVDASSLKRDKRQNRQTVVQRPQEEVYEYYDDEEEVPSARHHPTSSTQQVSPAQTRPYDAYNQQQSTSARQGNQPQTPPVDYFYDEYPDAAQAPSNQGQNTKQPVADIKISNINKPLSQTTQHHTQARLQEIPVDRYYDDYTDVAQTPSNQGQNAKQPAAKNKISNINKPLSQTTQHHSQARQQETPVDSFYNDNPDYATVTAKPYRTNAKHLIADAKVPNLNLPISTKGQKLLKQETPDQQVSPSVEDYYEDYPEENDATEAVSFREQVLQSKDVPNNINTTTTTEKHVPTESVKLETPVTVTSQLSEDYYDDYLDTTTHSAQTFVSTKNSSDIEVVEESTTPSSKHEVSIKHPSLPRGNINDAVVDTATPTQQLLLSKSKAQTTVSPATSTLKQVSIQTAKTTTQKDLLPITGEDYYYDYEEATTHAPRTTPGRKVPATLTQSTTQRSTSTTLGQDYYLSKDYVNDNYEPVTYTEVANKTSFNEDSVTNNENNKTLVEGIILENVTIQQNHDKPLEPQQNRAAMVPVLSKETNLKPLDDYYYDEDELNAPLPNVATSKLQPTIPKGNVRKSVTRVPVVAISTEQKYIPRINVDDIYFTTTYEDLLTTDQFSTTERLATETEQETNLSTLENDSDRDKLTTLGLNDNNVENKLTTTSYEEEGLDKLRTAVYTFLENENSSDETTFKSESDVSLTTLNSVPETTEGRDVTSVNVQEDVAMTTITTTKTTTTTTKKPTTVKSRRITNNYRSRFRTTSERPISSSAKPTTIQSLYDRSKTRRVLHSRHSTPVPPIVQIRTAGSMTRKPPLARTRFQPKQKEILEVIPETTEYIILTTNVIDDLTDLSTVKHDFNNDVKIENEKDTFSAVTSKVDLLEYSTESSKVPVKYSKIDDTSKEVDRSSGERVPLVNNNVSENSAMLSSKDENRNDKRAFNCKGRELYRYYADHDDSKLFHYCSTGFHSKQTLDFKFICDNGTVFNAQLQKCE